MALAIANSTGAGPVAASSLTFAHDAGSADRRWLFVKVGVSSAGEQPTVSGVTYDGVSLSSVRAAVESYAAGANIVREETWALEAPASGSNNVVVTLSGAADNLTAAAVTFSDCGGPGPNTGAVNGNISDISMGITSTEATSILLGGWRGAAVRGVTEGTGVTLIVTIDDGTAPPNNKLQWAGQKDATGGADTWAITLNSATRSAATVVEVLEDLGGGGGTEYTQGVAGALTTAGSVVRQSGKTLAGTLTTAGAVARQSVRALLGTLATAGAITRQASKSLAGSLSTAGAVDTVKTALISLGGTLTSAGAVAGRANKSLAGALSTSGAVVRSGRKVLAGTVVSAGSIVRSTSKSIVGTLSSAGAVAAVKTALVSLGGTLSTSGALARQTGKALGGTLAGAGTIARQISVSLSGALSAAGAVAKRAARSFAGTLSIAGALQSAAAGAVTGIVNLTLRARSFALAASARVISLSAKARSFALSIKERD